jgi:hypothetical protein
VSVAKFRRLIDIAEPRLRKLEAFCKPRSWACSGRWATGPSAFRRPRRRIRADSLPGTNSPPSIALVIASIAVMEEDGYLLLAGYLIGSRTHLHGRGDRNGDPSRTGGPDGLVRVLIGAACELRASAMADTLTQAPDGSRPAGVARRSGPFSRRPMGGEVTAGTLLASFGPRAFGLLLILLNLPNVVFAPPVLAGIAAVPTAVFGAQLLIGQSRPWLRRASAPADRHGSVGARFSRCPALDSPDSRASGDRGLAWAAGPAALRLLGFFALLCALIVLIPVPGTNVLPALSLVVIAIGIMRRDGCSCSLDPLWGS